MTDANKSQQRRRSGGRRAELERLMNAYFELSTADQLRAFQQIQEFLGAAATVDTKTDQLAADRLEALEVMARVVAHLGLAQGAHPTVSEFDRACRELNLAWTRTRVIRVWGRWRLACDAFRGEKLSRTAKQLAYQRRFSGRVPRYVAPLTAVRRFLATDPSAAGPKDYDAWVADANDSLKSGEMFLPTSLTVRNRLELLWPDVLRAARGDVELADLPKHQRVPHKDWTSGPDDLVGIGTVIDILGVSRSEAESRAREPSFPTSVATFGSTRAWLRTDITAYGAGDPFPDRQKDELRDRYLDARELGALIGLSPRTIKTQPKATFPRATGRVSAMHYWLRTDVDRWIAEHQALVAKRLTHKPMKARDDVGQKRLVTVSDLEKILAISADQAAKLVAERGFPEPATRIGVTPLWLRPQVDAYLTGQALPEADISAADVIGSRELAAMSGLSINTTRTVDGHPPPAGKAGRKNYWLRRDAEQWVRDREAKKRPGRPS